MGFRDFFTNRRYRKSLTDDVEALRNIRPPEKPSRRYIDDLVAKMLQDDGDPLVQRELSLIGAAAVPSLLAALRDPRIRSADVEESWQPYSALDSSLELLAHHAGQELLGICETLVRSPSASVRKRAATHLASTGRADAIPILQELMRDDDPYVRSSVLCGIDRAIQEERAQADFRSSAYHLVLEQLDQDWGVASNESASSLVRLDRERASRDLASERWLDLSNPNLHMLLEACNDARISLPASRVRRLLDEVLPEATKESPYPYADEVTVGALRALVLVEPEDARSLADSLRNHENQTIQIGAARALVDMTGVSDPIRVVLDIESDKGFEQLSHEQRVVYCAFLFDAEIRNGGLTQFFSNGSGDHTAETLASLEELGHEVGHRTLKAAVRIVGPLAMETDAERRLEGLEDRFDDLADAFEPLETAYYESPPLERDWLLYVARHADHFRC